MIFAVFLSVTFEPLHYLFNFRVFFTLITVSTVVLTAELL